MIRDFELWKLVYQKKLNKSLNSRLYNMKRRKTRLKMLYKSYTAIDFMIWVFKGKIRCLFNDKVSSRTAITKHIAVKKVKRRPPHITSFFWRPTSNLSFGLLLSLLLEVESGSYARAFKFQAPFLCSQFPYSWGNPLQ